MMASSKRRPSPAAAWSRRLGAFALVLFLTSAFCHRFETIETLPFLLLLGLCLLLGLGGLCLAVIGSVQIWEHDLAGVRSVALGAAFSLLALAPYAVAGYRMVVYPWLADVSTDLVHPPQFVRAPALRRPPMNPLGAFENTAAHADAYPLLAGRRYEHARESVIEAVNGLVADRGWTVLTPAGGGSLTLEVVARSYLLGFPADVAIRLEDLGNAVQVDMRSASRYGRHDMGDNALRIERFLLDLDSRVAASDDP